MGIGDCCWGRVAGFGVGCRLAEINMTAGINKSVDSTGVLGGYSPCVVVFVLMCTIIFKTPLYKKIKLEGGLLKEYTVKFQAILEIKNCWPI